MYNVQGTGASPHLLCNVQLCNVQGPLFIHAMHNAHCKLHTVGSKTSWNVREGVSVLLTVLCTVHYTAHCTLLPLQTCTALHCWLWHHVHCIKVCSTVYTVLHYRLWHRAHCKLDCGTLQLHTAGAGSVEGKHSSTTDQSESANDCLWSSSFFMVVNVDQKIEGGCKCIGIVAENKHFREKSKGDQLITNSEHSLGIDDGSTIPYNEAMIKFSNSVIRKTQGQCWSTKGIEMLIRGSWPALLSHEYWVSWANLDKYVIRISYWTFLATSVLPSRDIFRLSLLAPFLLLLPLRVLCPTILMPQSKVATVLLHIVCHVQTVHHCS